MTLTKLIDGRRIEVSAGEEQAIRDEWAAAPAPAEPGYREKRKAAYIAELGVDPSFQDTVGDVLDAVVKALNGDRTDFDAMSAKIAEIKARHPKPE